MGWGTCSGLLRPTRSQGPADAASVSHPADRDTPTSSELLRTSMGVIPVLAQAAFQPSLEQPSRRLRTHVDALALALPQKGESKSLHGPLPNCGLVALSGVSSSAWRVAFRAVGGVSAGVITEVVCSGQGLVSGAVVGSNPTSGSPVPPQTPRTRCDKLTTAAPLAGSARTSPSPARQSTE
jgi:hypothetical protein